MLSPETPLLKNHESLSITNESQFKKTRNPKLKMLAPLCYQRVNLETDAKTLYYSLLKLKYSLSIHLKHKREYASLDSSHRNHTIRISNRSIVLCILRDAFLELFCIFGDCYVSRMLDAEVTKSLIGALFCESCIFALLKIKSLLWEYKMCSVFFFRNLNSLSNLYFFFSFLVFFKYCCKRSHYFFHPCANLCKLYE